MPSPKPTRKVAESFSRLEKLFQTRNKDYKDSFHKFGDQLFKLVGPIELKTPADFGRFALFMQIAGKLSRYAGNFSKGGHPDSLDDISVYAQMLQELDHTPPEVKK